MERQDRDSVERIESSTGNSGITVRSLIEHVLRGHELVLVSLVRPPRVRQELAGGSNDLAAWPALKVADDRRFNVKSRHAFTGENGSSDMILQRYHRSVRQRPQA